MKKINLNSIIYLLVGLIVGTVISLSIVLIINNKNDKKLDSSVDNKLTIVTKTDEKEQKKEEDIKDDEEIDAYFERLSTSSNKNVIKAGFIKIVDFLFYNEPIKGKTFGELKESAKLKIIKAALYLDDKIDNYFPSYKETISTGAKNIYTKVKSKAVELYYSVTTKICSNNEQLCETAREDFQKMKSVLKISWEYIKDLGGDGLQELKEWYESFRVAY